MNLSEQVCNLGLAKRLKALGVIKESYFYYTICHDCTKEYGTEDVSLQEDTCHGDNISAFTVAEIGAMLPILVQTKDDEPFNNFKINMQKFFTVEEHILKVNYSINYHCDTIQITSGIPFFAKTLTKNIFDTNEANCRAKMLIWLIENNFVDVKNL